MGRNLLRFEECFAFSTQNITRSNKCWEQLITLSVIFVKVRLCPSTVTLIYEDYAVVQCSTYFFQALSRKVLLLLSYFGWIKMKRSSPAIFPAHRKYFPSYWKQIYVWNYIFSDPISIYLFEFSNNNSGIKCTICSKLTIKAKNVLVSLNIFDTFLVLFWLSLKM